MKKVERLALEIDKEEFINYYSSHTRVNTAEKYNISEVDVKALSKFFNFKKSREQIGSSVAEYYQTHDLIILHIPGDTHFIKVEKNLVANYLSQGYVIGYEQTEETKLNRINHCKQTKLMRYGDENYNNWTKNKQTKLNKYGDENYNNQQQIKETQFKLYGGYAFTCKEKTTKTNLERYGVEHNWSSKDPLLNGNATKFAQYGGKENYYKHIIEKGKTTKLLLYGDEFYSNHEQAQQTMLLKYGVPYFLLTDECREKTTSPETSFKRNITKQKNHTFNTSLPETIVEKLLQERFGVDDVIHNYQCSDYSDEITNYNYRCDFYIRSINLFIELNYHPTHGLHPFNASNEEDLNTLKILESNPTAWNKATIAVWTNNDVKKRNCAIKNKLNYLVLYPDDDYNDILNIIDQYLNEKGIDG